MRFVKPLDEELIRQIALGHGLLVTVEENVLAGGAGSAVVEYLVAAGIEVPVLTLGIPDRFISQDKPAHMLAECGLDSAGIHRTIREKMAMIERPIARSGF